MVLPWPRRLTSLAAKFLVAVIAIVVVAAPLTVGALRRSARLRIATAQVTAGPVVHRLTATGTLRRVDSHTFALDIALDIVDAAAIVAGEDASVEVATYPDDAFSATVMRVCGRVATVAVPDPGDALRAGMFAAVTLRGARRDRAVRIPTRALTFQPPADLVGADVSIDRDDAARRVVWEYDGRRFIPEIVEVGLADDQWTEMIDGVLHAGDALVTSANAAR